MTKTSKIIITLITLSLTGWSASLQAQTLSPEEQIKKSVQALGGADSIRQSFNYKASGKFIMDRMGRQISGDLEAVLKNLKNYRKVNLTFGGNSFTTISAYNGKTAWMDMQGSVADTPALDYESDADHTVLLLINNEAVIKPGKNTELEGKKVTGVEVEYKSKKTTFYFDEESGLLLEIAFQDYYFGQGNTRELIEKKIRYSDYREFNGVKYPARSVYYEKGQKSYEFFFDKMEFNPNTPDAIFDRPDEKMDLRYYEESMD